MAALQRERKEERRCSSGDMREVDKIDVWQEGSESDEIDVNQHIETHHALSAP